jgi:hypothetical protein
MRRAAVLATAALLVVGAAASLKAQAPNFSGKWTMQVDPNAAGGGGGGRMGGGGRGGFGQEFTAVQDAKTLTITRTTQNGEIKTVYNLDGSESKNTQSMGGNDVTSSSKAMWMGSKLMITTTTEFNGNSRETKMTLSIDGSGNLLVETTSPGRGGGDPVTRTSTYTKS